MLRSVPGGLLGYLGVKMKVQKKRLWEVNIQSQKSIGESIGGEHGCTLNNVECSRKGNRGRLRGKRERFSSINGTAVVV